MAKKFFRTVIQVTVLSEDEPIADGTDLEVISYRINGGDCSGDIKITTTEELTGQRMVAALKAQCSDPSFFGLDESGNALDEEDD